jgi:hypothetical protein
MAGLLNFPENPIVGTTWTVGSKTYRWSGDAWLVLSQTSSATTMIVSSPNNAVSTNSGALQVVGGVGIGGDLWIGGTLYQNNAPVLTTATLNASIFGGTDIIINTITTGTTTYLRFDNTSTLQTVTGRGFTTTNKINVTNVTESTSTVTGAVTIAGGLGVGKRINCESLRIADNIFDSSVVTVATTASTLIDSFLSSEFRSAKYFIQISSGGGANHTLATSTFQAVEIILITDNVGTVYATEYGLVSTGGVSGGAVLGSFTADLSIIDNTARLYFTPNAATNKTIKVLRTSMAS